MAPNEQPVECLILGIGNVLMGDEGIGVHVAQALQQRTLPAGIRCLDGGTGGLHLLGALQAARRVVLVDATVDGGPVGQVRQLRPRFAGDYPPTLTAHDIGLKDLLDALHVLGNPPEVILLAVSIAAVGDLDVDLSPPLARRLPELTAMVLHTARTAAGAGPAA